MTPSEAIELGDTDPASITIRITDEPVPPATRAVVECWDAMRIDKPRLFNGTLLSYTEHRGSEITVRRDSYQRMAVQAVDASLISPPVMQLSVTGLLVARDNAGKPHVFVGRRSHETRIYGGLWELGPAGGIDPPPVSHTSLNHLDVFRQLEIELHEETRLNIDWSAGPIVALTIDRHATAADIIMRMDVGSPLEDITPHAQPRKHRWEYEATRWVACHEFEQFVLDAPCIPPTISLAKLVGALA
ncbi:MAG: hypothetical protein AAF937_10165 [Planctomycetota bacterium]